MCSGFDGGAAHGVRFELATVLEVYCQFANALFVRGLNQYIDMAELDLKDFANL